MASYNLFGFLFKNRNNPDDKIPPSFAPPQNEDGAVVVEQNGAFTTVIDLDGIVKNEIELITKYREMASRAAVEGAISEIVNESIVTEEQKSPVSLVTDKLNYSDDILQKIQEEFETVLNLLDFNNEGQDIFRQWYTDGRLYYHIIIDPNDPRDGIQEIRPIDPRRIKPVIETESYVSQEGVPMQVEKQRYYVYNQFGSDAITTTSGVKIAWDSICYVHSGIKETNNTMILSHLHKALKPANMLSMVEDATVIYRLSRAPERRVFYIDVGNLPKGKAEQYLKDTMARYRNKMVYDACLCMDTMIPLLDGRSLSLTDIAQEMSEGARLWAYSADPTTGKLAPGLITSAGITRQNQKVIKIGLDNGDSVTCTLDHKFPIWGKGKVEAKDLIIGESVIPFYTRAQPIHGASKNSLYEQVFDNEAKKWLYTHRMVSKWKDTHNLANEWTFNPANITATHKTVHHVNYNRNNNTPENLTRMNSVDHFEYHRQHNGLAGRIGGAISGPICKERGSGIFGLTVEQKQDIGRRSGLIVGPRMVAEGKGIHGLTPTQTLENSKLGSKALQSKLNDAEFHKIFCAAISSGFSATFREEAKLRGKSLPHEHFVRMNQKANAARWTTKAKQTFSEAQSIEYPLSMIDSAEDCAKRQLSITQTLFELSSHDLSEWKSLNEGKKIKGKTTFDTITHNDLTRMSRLLGCNGFKALKAVCSAAYTSSMDQPVSNYKNHKVTSIEILAEPMDVGTLSIDRNEQYHDYHTFALSCGIFTCNSTGEVREDKKFLSFMEDYWLPRREGNRGTEITTLEGGQNLGEMADVEYFKENLYQSLNVPVGRLQSDSGFNLGRSAEISRDEVKFGKFIYRIRNRFTQLFDDLLSTQLMLKGIIAKEDWNIIRQKIFYSFLKDTYFSEMKNLEVIQNRMAAAESCLPFVGKYVSHEWMRRIILQQTDEEFKELDAQMLNEKADPRYQSIEAMSGGMPGMMPGAMGGGMGQDPSMMGGDPQGGGGPPGQGQDSNAQQQPPQGAGGSEDDEEGQDQQQMPPQDALQPSSGNAGEQGEGEDDDEEEGVHLNPDDLPSDRVTKNIESLWRRR